MPIKIEIRPLPGAQAVVQRLKALGDKGLLAQKDIVGSIQTVSELALAAAKASTPGPGKLRGMWGLTRWQRANFIRWSVVNQAEKTKRGKDILTYLEFGTKPHVIVPKNAMALRFLINRAPVFARKVFHPGTKPYMMYAGAEKVFVSKLTELFDEISRKAENAITTTL